MYRISRGCTNQVDDAMIQIIPPFIFINIKGGV